MRATVLHGTGGAWHLLDESGNRHVARLRGRVKHAAGVKLAVGDHVVAVIEEESGECGITEILPRHSSFIRRAPGGAYGERVVAANLDQLVVVMAIAKPEPHLRQLDRFLVIAEGNDIPARIVINKVELAPDPAARERFRPYEAIGYPLHFTSTKEPSGLEALHDALRNRTSALTGPSGVGKSSLMNEMYPGLQLRVGEISESVNKGRHTTVGAFMHPLPDGGFVVDTPGLREVGLWGLPSDELDDCFPEMRSRRAGCRFLDCRHDTEPGCAIREAVRAGEITADRYESYRRMLEEAREQEASR